MATLVSRINDLAVAIREKFNALSAGKADVVHDHAISDVTGLQTALDGAGSLSVSQYWGPDDDISSEHEQHTGIKKLMFLSPSENVNTAIHPTDPEALLVKIGTAVGYGGSPAVQAHELRLDQGFNVSFNQFEEDGTDTSAVVSVDAAFVGELAVNGFTKAFRTEWPATTEFYVGFGGADTLELAEIEFRALAGDANSALTVDEMDDGDGDAQAGYGPERLIDGSMSTGWKSNKNFSGFYVHFSEAVVFQEVVLKYNSANSPNYETAPAFLYIETWSDEDDGAITIYDDEIDWQADTVAITIPAPIPADFGLVRSIETPVTGTTPLVPDETGKLVLTPANLGLGNVDNTSDLNKPVSTATEALVNDAFGGAMASINGQITNVNNRTDGLIAGVNANIDALGQNIDGQKGAANGIATLDANGQVPASQMPALSAANLGLGNVDNTSDLDKPVSTATAAAITSARDDASAGLSGAMSSIYAQKGAVGGFATIGANGKVPVAQLDIGCGVSVQGTTRPDDNTNPIPFTSGATFTATASSSMAKAAVAATSTTVFTIMNGEATLGTVTFAASATVGSISITNGWIIAGDLLTLVCPATPDATLSGIVVVLRP
ncbi:MAG: hypothetical protein BGP16_15075 [Sphingobium sp. 66-54]|nr:MAG: hypothetical protein BGP16_15075 [Sphingobium sp. 66-54]